MLYTNQNAKGATVYEVESGERLVRIVDWTPRTAE